MGRYQISLDNQRRRHCALAFCKWRKHMAIFKGAGVAIVTPMNEDGSVNYEKFGELIEFQIANGTDAIIVCGTTGESSTLTHEEHLDTIKYCVDRKSVV